MHACRRRAGTRQTARRPVLLHPSNCEGPVKAAARDKPVRTHARTRCSAAAYRPVCTKQRSAASAASHFHAPDHRPSGRPRRPAAEPSRVRPLHRPLAPIFLDKATPIVPTSRLTQNRVLNEEWNRGEIGRLLDTSSSSSCVSACVRVDVWLGLFAWIFEKFLNLLIRACLG